MNIKLLLITIFFLLILTLEAKEKEDNVNVKPMINLIENIIKNMFDQTMTTSEQENMRGTIHNYFSQMQKCGKTFAANLMRGTPSFFLFTDSMEILVQWFGHADSRAIKKELDIFIDKKHG